MTRALLSVVVTVPFLLASAHSFAESESFSTDSPNPTGATGAETDGRWTFVLTPQLWIPHIESGGFAGTQNQIPTVRTVLASQGISDTEFHGANTEPRDPVDLQWGVQLAARNGRWAIGAGYQHCDFDTSTDLIYDGTTFVDINGVTQIVKGETVARELLNTSRTDADIAATYAFPDIIEDRLDLAIGVGFKMIYAETHRHFSDISPFVASVFALPPPGLYDVCRGDETCESGTRESFEDHVKATTWMYGPTIPIAASLHLFDLSKWWLPGSSINVAPFVGAETRDDRDVVYHLETTSAGFPARVIRQDGTFFAYGVTADAKLSWTLTDYMSAYLGMRVQYMNGESPNSDPYLAYGPLLGASVSFQPGG